VVEATVIAVVAVVLVLSCASPSLGRDSDGPRVGLKLGWPWSWVSYDGFGGKQETDSDTRIFSGGVVLDLPLAESGALALASGITYVVRSGAPDVESGPVTDEDGDPIGTLISDWNYYCLAFPLSIKYSSLGGGLVPYVAGGAEIGIPLKAERVSSLSPAGGGAATSGTRDVKDKMGAVELSLMAACGLEFPVGARAGFVELTYVHGLTDVWKDDLEEVRFRTLTLSGGIMF
jgi:hypothetical protein